ncbi:MAG: translation initiation factor IF-2 [Deltaproteobacteria bacterium]|nr:MAG: translation initiation factor IF-2 [Deltaproteobacteria bacterium]
MSNVRVYELAKELNMNSSELVEKLKSAGLSINNYMSTLDSADVARAKDYLSGATSEVFEEKRIKPTVIRRRKKIVPMVPDELQAEETAVEREVAASPEEAVSGPEEGISEVGEKLDKEPEQREEESIEAGPEVTGEAKEEIGEEVEEEGKRETLSRVSEELGKERDLEFQEEAVVERKVKKGEPKVEKKKRAKPKSVPARIIKLGEAPLPEPKAHEPAKVTPTEIAVPRDEKAERVKEPKRRRKEEVEDLTPKREFHRRRREIFERKDLYGEREVVGLAGKAKLKAKGKLDKKKFRQTEITTPKAIKRRIKVPSVISVAELAKSMGVKAAELIKKLLEIDIRVTLNQTIEFDSASLVAGEFGYELELSTFEEEDLLAEETDKPEDLVSRPPVITIMGHVDHGKTSLLDYIRKSRIIDKEAGGITQHIGAYYVNTPHGDFVFLDTPGHEAFTAMRARGAKVTDLIVLVVAADDGVKEQTIEAINHAKAADIPIIVAVNKMDKANADQEKVRRELTTYSLVAEEWGGDTLFSYVSAKTGEGVDGLLEAILLQSEILELKANPNRSSRGVVIEARLDKNRGPVAAVLIRNGTLKQGEFFVSGENYGRVRAMLSDRGQKIKSASPSTPVEIYGISGVPMAGDDFVAVSDEKKAKMISEHRKTGARPETARKQDATSLDTLYDRIKEGKVKELNIIVKADVQGSVEALTDSLTQLSTEEVKLKVIHGATGAVTESDVMLASASDAIIICFSVRANPMVRSLAEREKVEIRFFDVIYQVIEDIKSAMTGLLEPIYNENIIGRADVKDIFHISKIGTVAGCYVTDGKIERNAKVRLLRDDVVVFDGQIGSLKRFKDDAREVLAGFECGVGIDNYNDIKPGDVLEVYVLEETKAEL